MQARLDVPVGQFVVQRVDGLGRQNLVGVLDIGGFHRRFARLGEQAVEFRGQIQAGLFVPAVVRVQFDGKGLGQRRAVVRGRLVQAGERLRSDVGGGGRCADLPHDLVDPGLVDGSLARGGNEQLEVVEAVDLGGDDLPGLGVVQTALGTVGHLFQGLGKGVEQGEGLGMGPGPLFADVLAEYLQPLHEHQGQPVVGHLGAETTRLAVYWARLSSVTSQSRLRMAALSSLRWSPPLSSGSGTAALISRTGSLVWSFSPRAIWYWRILNLRISALRMRVISSPEMFGELTAFSKS
jgi:hypothetical protein